MNLNRLRERVNKLKSMTINEAWCGWMVDDVAAMLYAMVKHTQPDIIIQTGHLWGKSAVVAMEAMDDDFLRTQSNRIESEEPYSKDQTFYMFVTGRAPHPKSKRFISIDPLPLAGEAPINFIKEIYPFYEFYPTHSQHFFAKEKAALVNYCADKTLFGIVDGDHSVAGCTHDLVQLADLGASYIVVDDTRWLPPLGLATRKFAADKGYDLIELPSYNGIVWLSKLTPPEPSPAVVPGR